MHARQISNSPEQPREKVRLRRVWSGHGGDNTWLQSIYKLSRERKLSDAANKIYWYFDNLLCDGHFSECDKLLKAVKLDLLAPELWTAFLIISVAAKDKLQSRAEFYADIKKRLIQMGERPEDILHGLE